MTKSDIIKQLKQMNAPQDKPVIVHTSLRAVGKLQGGGQTLLDALVEYFTFKGGILIIPAHTWVNFYELKKEPSLDFCDNKTCVGTLCDIALADGRGKRTFNPTHSLTIFGEDNIVKEFLESEENVNTPTSPLGAYGKIFDKGGFVLLIGVGQEKNTFIHCVEEMLCVPNRLSNDCAKVSVKLKDGSTVSGNYRYMQSSIEDVSVFFPKYEPAFREHGAIVDGFIGKAKTQLCSAVKIKQVVQKVRENSGGIELLADDKPLKKEWYKN